MSDSDTNLGNIMKDTHLAVTIGGQVDLEERKMSE